MAEPITAFLAIDVQNDFCAGGALEVPDGDAVVTPINELMARYPVRVLTQDWHPRDHFSFASNTEGGKPFGEIEAPYGRQTLWPDHCVQGSKGAEFHPDLNTVPADLILRKGYRSHIDSYSAFFENDQTTPTGLDGYLRERGVERLVMAGLATDVCVKFSALDGAKLGYPVIVVRDACRGIDMDGSLAAAYEEMRAAGVTLAEQAEL
jgi:nicotinamidase/pyrazinamidase